MPDPWFTEAQVEKAARNICWAEIGGGRISPPTDAATVLYVDANWHRHVYQAGAALSAIPDPRAAARAEGFEAAKIAISAETACRWPEADALLDWIDDLKPELKL